MQSALTGGSRISRKEGVPTNEWKQPNKSRCMRYSTENIFAHFFLDPPKARATVEGTFEPIEGDTKFMKSKSKHCESQNRVIIEVNVVTSFCTRNILINSDID